MGGKGSTRWAGHQKRQMAEDCYVFSVSGRYPEVWQKPPVPEGEFGRWERAGQVIRYTFAVDPVGGAGTAFVGGTMVESVIVALTSTEPYFGGRRWYWVCPNCSKRVANLYLPPGSRELLCRHCHRLAYRASQQHDKTLDRFYRMTRAELEAATRSENARTREKARRVLEERLHILSDGYELFF